MYQQHFGLREPPFCLTPDTSFFYNYPGHQEALNVLLVALRMGEGFIKVTGEVGTGKTLICRKLLNMLGEDDVVTAYIPNPFLAPTALRHALAEELGIEYARNIGQHRVLQLINEKLMALRGDGRRVVLLIDEAQALPEESLEAIRLLTNLETEKSKLLQVVLFGQPELDEHLDRRSVRQLKQRITFSYNLQPLSCNGVAGYLQHRLKVAGSTRSELFHSAAIKQLCRGSRGVPRLVNIIANKALLVAFGEGAGTVSRKHVRRAITDTEDATVPRSPLRTLWLSLLGITASSAVGASAYLLLGGGV